MGNESKLNPVAQAAGQGPIVLEARGRALQPGDEIILSLPGPLYFRVADITPVLDPNAPANLLLVHVGCMLTFTAKRGAVNREFIRVRTEAEAGPSQFQLLDAKPAPAGPIGVVKAQGDGDPGEGQ